MKRFLLICLAGIGGGILWQGCSEDSTQTGPVNTVIIKYDTLYDTISGKPVKDTGIAYFDSIVSTSVVTLTPVDTSTKNIVIKTTTVTDSIFKFKAEVESTVVKRFIYELFILDSLFVTTMTSHKDTLDTIDIDTISDVAIRILKDSLINTSVTVKSFSKKQYYLGYLVTTTSDYRTGNVGVGTLSLDDKVSVLNKGIMLLHPDNKVFSYKGAVYILESFGADRIMRFDGPTISQVTKIYQVQIGVAVNLHDMAFAGIDKAYLTQYADSMLVIVDPRSGTPTGTINLGRYGMVTGKDSVEVPYMDKAMVINDKLYVLCQRLQTVQTTIGPVPMPTKLPGLVVVISTEADSVIDTIRLTMKNPASMDTAGGYLYVSSTGEWFDKTDGSTKLDGGIEKIDIAKDSLAGVVGEEKYFLGNISQIVLVNQTKGYVLVSKSDGVKFWTEAVEFNPAAGSVGYTLNGVDDAFGGILYDGIYLYVADRSTRNPGVIVFDPSNNRRIAGPLSFGPEPPTSMAVLVTNRK